MTALKIWLLIVAVLAFLAFHGLPIALLLRHRLGTLTALAMSPVAGVAAISTWNWYANDVLGIGLRTPARLLVAVEAVAVGALLTRRAVRRDLVDAARRARWAAPVFLAASAVVLAVAFSPYFGERVVTSVSLGNNDVAAYALASQQIIGDGFDEPGPLVGYNLSRLARDDVYGTLAVLGSFEAVTGVAVWKTTFATLLACVTVAAAAGALVARRVLGLAAVPAVLVGVLSVDTYLLVYVAGQYFLAQIIGMAATACLLTALVSMRTGTRRDALMSIAGLVPPMVTAIFVYPHMLFFGAPLLVLAAVPAWCRGVRGTGALIRTVVRHGLVVLAGLAVAGALVPHRFALAVERSVKLSTAEAGWKLPALSPADVIGFQDRFNGIWSQGEWILSIGAAALVLVCAVLVGRAGWHHATAALVLIALCLGTYRLVVQSRGGFSYQQWKWVSYFQPLVIIAVAGLVALALTRLGRRRPAATMAVVLVLGAVALGAAARNARLPSRLYQVGGASVVDATLFELRDEPLLASTSSVNVQVGPYWDTMWVAYFLAPHVDEIRLVSPSYFPPAAPEGLVTLLSTAEAEKAGITYGVPLGARLVLVGAEG